MIYPSGNIKDNHRIKGYFLHPINISCMSIINRSREPPAELKKHKTHPFCKTFEESIYFHFFLLAQL